MKSATARAVLFAVVLAAISGCRKTPDVSDDRSTDSVPVVTVPLGPGDSRVFIAVMTQSVIFQ